MREEGWKRKDGDDDENEDTKGRTGRWMRRGGWKRRRGGEDKRGSVEEEGRERG